MADEGVSVDGTAGQAHSPEPAFKLNIFILETTSLTFISQQKHVCPLFGTCLAL